MDKILCLAANTFRESVRSKIMYSIVFFILAIAIVSSIFGVVTIGDKVKVLKDFGLFSLSLFGVAYIVITGATLLNKELTKKTVYNILSKPVKRWEFLAGKYLGMLYTVIILTVLMGAALLLYIYFYESKFDNLILTATYSILLQMIILCAFAIFFSTIVVTPLLSGAFTFGIFLAGRSTEQILEIAKRMKLEGIADLLFSVLYYVIPHLDKIDISNKVVYGQSVEPSFLLYNSVYAVGYAILLIIISTFIFDKREFN